MGARPGMMARLRYRQIHPLQRQKLLRFDIEILVVVDKRLDQFVDIHEGNRDTGAFGFVAGILGKEPAIQR